MRLGVSNSQRFKQLIDLAVAVGEFVEMDANLVEQREVQIGQRSRFAEADVASAFHTAGRSGGAIAVLLGAAWLATLTVANVAAQSQLPDWMRGRGMAIYLMVFAGAMSAGSLVWGWLADQMSVRMALLAAGGVGVLFLLLAWRRPLPEVPPDLTPAMHWWPDPYVAQAIAPDRGPVLVSIEYQVAGAGAGEFLALLRELAQERLRDGAYQWAVYEDVSAPGRYVETFLVTSWEEHQRQYTRISHDDALREAAVTRFHAGPAAPLVRHLVAPERG